MLGMSIGRREIFTDETVITSENIVKVLRQAFVEHQINADRINFLLRYEAGNQPIMREKKYRADINVQCVDNVANEITEFKLGFKWGNPITLVQRGESDSGKEYEPKGISLLNEQYETAGIKSKTQQLARFIEIGGLGYTFVDINTDYEDGDAFFNLEVLDPRCTFVVKSNSVGKKKMLGVTYRKDDKGNSFFTAFTRARRYEIINLVKVINADGGEEDVDEWYEGNRSGEMNPLGEIPIIEWQRSYDRMGCFERQIPDMDALNILESDMINASSEQVDCIWHCNDVDFPEDENGNIEHPQSNDWLQTYTSKDGKTPFVTPLSPNYDYAGNLDNVKSKRALILQKCDVPQRDTTAGGSSGIAMSDATGWSAAESSACKDEQITTLCKMEEVKVVLKAIKKSPYIEQDNAMLKLKYSDMVPNIKRQKTYEMTVKINAFATGVSHGLNGYHMLKAINMFDDPNMVWEDSKEGVEAFQKTILEPKQSAQPEGGDGEKAPDSERTMQDHSDQVERSPRLNG